MPDEAAKPPPWYAGRWMGGYRLGGMGSSEDVDYIACAGARMIMQLDLAPLAEHRDEVVDLEWTHEAVSFCQDANTRCRLTRRDDEQTCEGQCFDANGAVNVVEITIGGRSPLQPGDCDSGP